MLMNVMLIFSALMELKQ